MYHFGNNIRRVCISVILVAWLLPSALYGQLSAHKNISQLFKVKIPTAIGKEFPLDSLRQNRANVLLFLSENCPICQKYTPTIRSLYQEFAEKNIGFFGVFPSPFIVVDSVKNYMKYYALPFLMLIDSNQTVTRLTKARITPEAVVISSEGDILYQGRIDNLFAALGRQRATATTHELLDVLTALSSDVAIPSFRNNEPIGCFIELLKSSK
jgi:peroxiredoxin